MSWRDWFRRDDPIAEELESHLRMAIEERVARGESPADAERNARRELGNLTHVSEVTREQRRGTMFFIDELAQDLRYAVRQLKASPGFTAAMLVTLSVGIGVTTIIYSLSKTLEPPPTQFRDAGGIVHVAQGTGGDCVACFRMAQGNYLTIRSDARSLEGVSLIGGTSMILRAADRTVLVDATVATPSMFRTLGIQAMLGRTLVDADTLDPRGTGAVVLNETLWRTHFGSESGIVGRTIILNARSRTVVGIIAAASAFPSRAMVWEARRFDASSALDRSWTNEDVVARLRPGVTIEQARAELATIGARIAREFPQSMRDWTFDAMPFLEWLRPRGGEEFLTISSAVAVVLAIACINLAGLLIARLTTRRKELAVRAAMGAGSGRIVRQLLAETGVIAVLSGVLGALLAKIAIDAIRTALPAGLTSAIPNWGSLRVDLAALGFAISAAVLTGIAIALWPALKSAQPSLVSELKDGARNVSSAGGVSGFRRGLVVAEVAFAIVVLHGAGLLARSVAHLNGIHPGFRTDKLLTLRVVAPSLTGADSMRVDSSRYERLAGHLAAVPGVVRAAAVMGLPFSGSASTRGFDIDAPSGPPIKVPSVRMVSATSDYFGTMEIAMLRGRGFTPQDRSSSARVAIIDSTLSARYFKDRDPIGAQLVIDKQRWEVVGVARNSYYGAMNLRWQFPGEVYRPMSQVPWRGIQLAIRTAGKPEQVTHSVEQAVRVFDPDLAVRAPMSMEALMSDDVAPWRLVAMMMVGFALSALLIAVIGLYSVIGYTVATRTREFGIRRALGAGAGTLIGLVLGQGARLTLLGAAIGVAGAFAVTRLMGAMLFGVRPGDPATLLAVAALMCFVGIAAAYVPARRASRVDPIISLRAE